MRANTVALSYMAWKNGTGSMGVENGGRGRLCGVETSEILMVGSFSDLNLISAVQTFNPVAWSVKYKNINERKAKASVCHVQVQKGGSSELRIFLLNELKKGCDRGIKDIFHQSRRDRKLTAERNKTYTNRFPLCLSHPWHQSVCENILCQCACFIKRDWCCLCGQRRLVLDILFCVSKYYKKHMWEAHVICLYFLWA